MRGLLEAWVARLAECRLKQKAGYGQHASHPQLYADQNGEILNVLWELKKKGKADPTIKNVGKALQVLAKHTNLDNPEEVRTYIATTDKKNGYKRALCYAYDHYVKQHCLTWNKPTYYQNARAICLKSQEILK